MIKRFNGLLVVLGVLAAGSALADEASAAKACEDKLRQEYRVDSFRDVWADKEGHHKYRVYGKVKTRDHKYPFQCKVQDGRVKSYSYDGPHSRDDSDADAAVAVAAGLAVVAALAIASSEGGDDASDRHRHRQTYLEDDCHDELTYRIRDEHNRTARVELTRAALDGRDLVGEARVQYEGHHPHRATYTCHFNREGHLVDSQYRLY